MASQTRGVFSLRQIYNQQRKGTGYPIADVFTQRPNLNTNPFGYFSGGWDTVGAEDDDYLSSTVKLTFSTDAYSALPTSANLATQRYGFQAASSDTTHYVSAGYVAPSAVYLSSTEKITIATETRAAVPGGNQASSHWLSTGAVSTDSIAYFMGGYAAPNMFSYANKLTFSNETMSEIPNAKFPASARTGFAMSGNSTAGYASAGVGDPWANITITDKLTFSTDSTARVPGANTLVERQYTESVGNGSQMYMTGGDNSQPQYLSSTEKMVFADETYAASPSAQMTNDRRYFSRLSGGASAFLAGGQSESAGGFISKTDKLNFSTDTTSNISTGNLPAAIRSMAGSSSQECGKNYGLLPNFSKIEALPIRCSQDICNSDGSGRHWFAGVFEIFGLLTACRRTHVECAEAADWQRQSRFDQLRKVWGHASVSTKVYLNIYYQCIISNLLYAMESAWLIKDCRNILDAFTFVV